jgi:hypothetical protein
MISRNKNSCSPFSSFSSDLDTTCQRLFATLTLHLTLASRLLHGSIAAGPHRQACARHGGAS